MIFQTAGELMIGSRFKRLGEKLFAEIGRVYKDLKIPFEPAWFPVFFLLDRQTALPVTALARAMDVSDSAASQLVRRLEKAGLIVFSAGDADKRIRLVTLSVSGRRLLERVRPVWSALSASLAEMETGEADLRRLLAYVSELEEGLQRETLAERVRRRIREPLVCGPLLPEGRPAADKWLALAGEILSRSSSRTVQSWICSQGGRPRGILSVAANGGGDRIETLALDVWEPQVTGILLKEWRGRRSEAPWLAVLNDAADGLWPPRLLDMGFVPEKLHSVPKKNDRRLLEWRLDNKL